ncbi:uncharacterized protein isoform X2 [Bombus fervidus]|uniref:uncharacterized protein isoform X2 n=1 Tax=Bombus fervidus TaxID=203811 RepID=UPI003AB8F029
MCRFQRNRIYVASVSAAIMSQVAVPRVFLYLLAAFLVTFSKASLYVPPDDCLKFDVGDIEDYLSNLNFENVPTINMMIGGFKCPVTALPFRALKSDWARLLLLRKAQPKESIFLKKLDRLIGILVIAYFRMEERFDVMQSGFWSISSPTATSVHESTTSTDSKEETKKLDNSIANSREINKTSVNFPISPFFNTDESSSTFEIERRQNRKNH